MNPLVPLLNGSPFPRFDRLADYLGHYADLQPEAEAVADSARRMTWRTLQAEVDAAASALVAAGVTEGDRVAVLSPPCCDFWVLFLATASIGATWLGLNPRHTHAELSYILGDARPRLLFGCRVGEEERATLNALQETLGLDAPWIETGGETHRTFLSRQAEAGAFAARRGAVTGDDVALLVYTSGSTGRPKGARLHQAGIARAAWAHATVWRAEPFRGLNNLPVNHVGCVCDLACTTLAAGGFTLFMERFDAEGSLASIAREGLTFWGQVPTQFQMSLERLAQASYDLSSLQLIVWSGARAPLELVQQLHALCPRLATSYGMTETVGSVTMSPVLTDPAAFQNMVGWPDPGRDIRLGADGQIEVGDAYVMRGYLGRPDADAEAWAPDGWFRTGDLGQINEDGSISLVGRAKEMFKSGGYNVYPREVEEALEEAPQVSSAVVVPMPDDLYGEVGCAFLVAEGDGSLDPEVLKAELRGRLANYKIPKRFVVLEAFPLLSVGKVDRAALRGLAEDRSAA